MTKLRFSFHGFVIVDATISVTDFVASSDFILIPSYRFAVWMFECESNPKTHTTRNEVDVYLNLQMFMLI